MALVVVFVLYLNFRLDVYYLKATKSLNDIVIDCNNASHFISPNSIVLPLNYSNNWLLEHYSNYLGIDKPMVILENYECKNDYFPLKWNDQSIPNTLLGSMNSDQLPCVQWKSNTMHALKKIDYVFMLGTIDAKTDSCNTQIKRIISEHYRIVYATGNCTLYENK